MENESEMNTEDTQQFCLRWHNYQSSLLATLPQLLDGDDLTDVTLCAGSRSLKAHRVVLSACSEYFKELFKELGPSHHPVIVLPGVEFADLCALVTFMYSGEVNIYESQLASLLSMADVLHIRGLADFSNTTNLPSKTSKNKRARLNDGQDLISKLKNKPALPDTEVFADWPVPASSNVDLNPENTVQDLSKRLPPDNNNDSTNSSSSSNNNNVSNNNNNNNNHNNNNTLDGNAEFKRMDYSAYKMETITNYMESFTNTEDPSTPTDLTQTGTSEIFKSGKGSVAKTFTMCFICGKQLSNHYNLRVHMETHQNMQYACSACSHVSRSRDALRKHVSYRHPPTGALLDGSPSQKKQQQQQQPSQQQQPQQHMQP